MRNNYIAELRWYMSIHSAWYKTRLIKFVSALKTENAAKWHHNDMHEETHILAEFTWSAHSTGHKDRYQHTPNERQGKVIADGFMFGIYSNQQTTCVILLLTPFTTKIVIQGEKSKDNRNNRWCVSAQCSRVKLPHGVWIMFSRKYKKNHTVIMDFREPSSVKMEQRSAQNGIF